MVKHIRIGIMGMIVVCMIGSLAGCDTVMRKKIEWNPAKPKQPAFTHTVQYSGETLSIIAKWYTGDSSNWRSLAKANPTINPQKVIKNNKIVIPESLLKTRVPMPESYVTQFFSKPEKKKKAVKISKKKNAAKISKKTKKKSETSPTVEKEEDIQDEEFELFGPKDVMP